MGETDARGVDLPVAGLAPKLPGDLADLGDAGRAEWVTLREQTTTRVDRLLTADAPVAFVEQPSILAGRTEAETLDAEDLSHREAVVDLRDVDVLGPDPGHLVGDLRAVVGNRLE